VGYTHPPALVRGIEILRLLEGAEALGVEAIFERTGFPRSSLRRILEGLEALGCVRRDQGSMEYRPLVKLLSVEHGGRELEVRVAAGLAEITRSTGLTAEWYVPTERGMVLAGRRAPESGEVRVQARMGFLRAWNVELEAVCAVGRAFFAEGSGAEGMWQYDAKGEREPVSPEEVARRVAEAARTGASADAVFNANGVRRSAAVVRHGGRPVGVIALAEPLTPGPGRQEEHLAALLAAADQIDRRPGEVGGAAST